MNVERDSQKKILIGHKGGMLKKIGTEARKELEAILGSKIYLGLFVKVAPDWREKPPKIRALCSPFQLVGLSSQPDREKRPKHRPAETRAQPSSLLSNHQLLVYR